MPSERQFSDETVKTVTARIHHHRQAAEIVKVTLALLSEYMQADVGGNEVPISELELRDALQAPLSRLESRSEQVRAQIASDDTSLAISLIEEWRALHDELSAFVGRTDAASIPQLRTCAIAARSLATRTLAATGTSRRKESAKAARDAAAELHRLTCMYELLRARQLLEATTDGLLVPINVLEGKPLSRASTKVINVPDVVRDSIKLHTAAARRKGIEFKERFQCEVAYVAIDADDLLRALGNMFSNAIKYMGTLGPRAEYDNTWITVSVSANSTLVSIGIQSWGAPFTPEEVRTGSVFEWGTRGHFAWKVAGADGSGVGLNDSRDIIRGAGGEITLATDPVERFSPLVNRTTTFTIRLPRLDE